MSPVLVKLFLKNIWSSNVRFLLSVHLYTIIHKHIIHLSTDTANHESTDLLISFL